MKKERAGEDGLRVVGVEKCDVDAILERQVVKSVTLAGMGPLDEAGV